MDKYWATLIINFKHIYFKIVHKFFNYYLSGKVQNIFIKNYAQLKILDFMSPLSIHFSFNSLILKIFVKYRVCKINIFINWFGRMSSVKLEKRVEELIINYLHSVQIMMA